ncbi:hypothetical protein LTR28_005896 [Elasticomyces elasticus]|nr:hypothetical protein LTR28_005896 [Elasticomyces elasticus]
MVNYELPKYIKANARDNCVWTFSPADLAEDAAAPRVSRSWVRVLPREFFGRCERLDVLWGAYSDAVTEAGARECKRRASGKDTKWVASSL